RLNILSTNKIIIERTITGQITDENTEPLPGVSVLVKGTNIGTITDTDGRFSLTTPTEGVLVFSYVGYVTQEITIGTRNVIELSMLPDIRSLCDVDVSALGIKNNTKRYGIDVQDVKEDEHDTECESISD